MMSILLRLTGSRRTLSWGRPSNHLNDIRPLVAHPGNPDEGIPSDPTNGAYIEDLGEVPIDIAYAGSCTAGKDDDFAYYARVTEAALNAGLRSQMEWIATYNLDQRL